MAGIRHDVRYAIHSLAGSPGYTAVSVLALALGIGTSVSMFTVMLSVLWQPLPFRAPAELVVVDASVQSGSGTGLSGREAHEILARTNVFDRLSLATGLDAHVEIDGEIERLAGVSIGGDLLQALGLDLALGRHFDARDKAVDDAGQVRSIIISDSLWRRKLGSDPAAVGRSIIVNNSTREIVGVLPPGTLMFLPGSAAVHEETDVWFPSLSGPTDNYRGNGAIGRLASNVELSRAQQELDGVARQLIAEHPSLYKSGQLTFHVRALHEAVVIGASHKLRVLALAVAFVLLVSCGTVTNLTLARASVRSRDVAVRQALGAGRARLVRQFLSESIVLSSFAGVLGLLLAWLGIGLIAWLNPADIPRLSQVGIDGGVLLFAVSLSFAVGAFTGILPALRHSFAAVPGLCASRSNSASPLTRRLQRGLTVAQIALSIAPLAAAGLMLRSLDNLQRTPLGFEPAGVITAWMPVTLRLFSDSEARWRLHQDVLERLRAHPGIEAASAASPLPFYEETFIQRYGRVEAGDPVAPATVQVAMPGYLPIVGTRILAGRDFTNDDVRLKRAVVIIDRRIANELWPGGAVGQKLALAAWSVTRLEVVGVTEPVRITDLRGEAPPHVFLPYHQFPIEMALVIKSKVPAATLAPVIRRAATEAGTGRAVFDILPLQTYVDRSMSDTRFMMLMLVSFGSAGIALAGIGLYGTLAYLTEQRKVEFGVRLALGATRTQILAQVAREGLGLTIVGLVVGLIAAGMLAQGLRSLLHGVGPLDWMTLGGVAAVTGCIAILAGVRPALAASGIDPVLTLRSD